MYSIKPHTKEEKRSMENPKIIEIISNLKGRRNYEEKKAVKLGYATLYEYFEDKLQKEASQKKEIVPSTPKKTVTQPQETCNGCC